MQFNIPAEHKRASGVYIIRNSINSKVYVGSAIDFKRRYYEHVSRLKTKKHSSRKLQSFAGKYGIDALSFDLLEIVERDKITILTCEQKWLDYYRCCESNNGFNNCFLATSSLGVKQSAETRAKIAAIKTGLRASIETKQKMSEASRNRPSASPETRAKLSVAKRNQTLETRQKIGAKSTGRVFSNETREKMSQIAKQKGFRGPQTPESIAKRVASRRANPENTGKQKGRIVSDKTRKKISEATKGRPAIKRSAEGEAKRIAGVKAGAARRKAEAGQLHIL